MRGALASMAVPTILPSSVFGQGDRPAPGNRITVGVIGIGARGLKVCEEFLALPDAQVVAICDVHDFHYRDREWGAGNPMGWKAGKATVDKHYGNTDCAAYTNAQEIISRDDIDVVAVVTPDHWHALNAMDALRSGKDVYCEKPVTHYFAEGQALYKEVAKREAVFQVGSQQRSEDVFRRAVELVRNGHIGKVKRVEVGLPAGHAEPLGSTEITDPPEGVDYDAWCGPSEKLPFMRAYFHRNWRFNSHFGGGNIMDWIGHHNDIAHWGMGFENSGPLSLEAKGWTFPARTDVYDTPVEFRIECTYPGDVEWTIASQNRKGTKWIGEDGWVFVDRGILEASNEEWVKPDFNRGEWKAYFSKGHQRNFLDCVKSRKPTVAPAENGHRSITPGHLSYISHAVGRKLEWDPKTEQIQNDEEAQKLLMRIPYRAGWEFPA